MKRAISFRQSPCHGWDSGIERPEFETFTMRGSSLAKNNSGIPALQLDLGGHPAAHRRRGIPVVALYFAAPRCGREALRPVAYVRLVNTGII